MKLQSGILVLGFLLLQLSDAVPIGISAPIVEPRTPEVAEREIVSFGGRYNEKREASDAKRGIVSFGGRYNDKREASDAKRGIVSFGGRYNE